MHAFRFFSILISCLLLWAGMSSCWSARCPRGTCRVRVEHRHGESYFRPREAFSWMWTPRYKHVRTPNYALMGAPGAQKKKVWYRFLSRNPKITTQKPRK
ncbi:MAG: hypothetical protein HQ448_10600 [Cytophagales bacterium]|nr:hypothetical protein [Cytophagales bacterium]